MKSARYADCELRRQTADGFFPVLERWQFDRVPNREPTFGEILARWTIVVVVRCRTVVLRSISALIRMAVRMPTGPMTTSGIHFTRCAEGQVVRMGCVTMRQAAQQVLGGVHREQDQRDLSQAIRHAALIQPAS